MTLPILRLGTYNVRCDFAGDGEQRWEKRRDRFLAQLLAWQPDVLCLQEPFSHQLAQIDSALPDYDWVGVGRDDGESAGEFCPIFYRRGQFQVVESGTFWFARTPHSPGTIDWGCRHPRICTWARLSHSESGTMFWLYNVHLDHESQLARDQSTLLLLDKIGMRSPLEPAILLGDFNAGADNPALARLRSATSPVPVHAFTARYPNTTLPGTFHGFTGEADEDAIDHIFLSPEWEVREIEVLVGDGTRPFPSDHFPVAATLRLPADA